MISLSDVSLAHGTRTLFADVSLQIVPGSRIALVGANGAGKTTLLEIVSGEREPDTGTVSRGKDVTVGLLRQEIAETAGRPVVDEVLAGSDLAGLEERMRHLEQAMAAADGDDLDEIVEHYGRLQAHYEQLGGYGVESEARRILAGLGFPDERMDRDIGELSGGWMMRVALARLLLARPDVLLLDEPTNHLDLESVRWLEQFLHDYDGAVLLVSHDRDFINGIANRVVELAFGTATEYAGDYQAFTEQREMRLEQLRNTARNQQARIDQLERFIERFRYKNTLATRVQSKIKMLDKMDRIDVPEEHRKAMRFRFPDPPRAGRVVVELEHVAKSYGGTVVYTDLDLVLERGQKVALVGPNGAGKSTLLRIVAGVEPIDGGTRTLGHNVEVAYYAQHQIDALDLGRTVLAELSSVVDTRRVNPRSMLGAFQFSGEEVDKPVGVLSGGERSRLALAKLMADPVNLLCMDEPTNHLDIPSRDVVEDALVEYPGTILLITHDRHLIRSVADAIVEVRDGRVTVFADTTYDEYLERTGGDLDGRAEVLDEAPTPPPVRDRDQARKREEAERRNRIYRETKEIRDRLAAVERDLGAAEAEVAELTRTLADPDVYADEERVRELVARHGRVKDRAADLFRAWEQLYAANEEATARAEAAEAEAS